MDDQIKLKAKENNLIQKMSGNSNGVIIKELDTIKTNKEFSVSLDMVNFTNVSIDDMVEMVKHNKVGTIMNNPNKDYVLNLAHQNVELAKSLLNRYGSSLENHMFSLLNYVLANDSKYVININSIIIDHQLDVMQSYLKVNNIDFVNNNISAISPTLYNDFLLPYKYDSSKSLFEVMFENNVKFEKEYYDFFLKNGKIAVAISKNNFYMNEVTTICSKLQLDYFFQTLSKIDNGNNLITFISNNFVKFISNYYVLDLANKNDNITKIYVDNGVFLPFENQIFRKLFGKYTILEYALLRFNSGDIIDLDLKYFDNLLYKLSNYGNDFFECVSLYCKYGLFSSLQKLELYQFVQLFQNNKFSVLDYILSINPKFEVVINSVALDSKYFDIIESYMKVGNWDFVSKNISNFFAYCLIFPYKYNPDKMIIEILQENNITLSDDLINNLGIFLTKMSTHDLLDKDNYGVTLLEKVLKINRNVGLALSKYSFEVKKLPIEASIILAKYGWYSDVDYRDKHNEEFNKYISEWFLNRAHENYLYSWVLTQKEYEIVERFIDKFKHDSDDTLINMNLNVFSYYLTFDKEKAMQYLNNLIKMKENNPLFTLNYDITYSSSYDSTNKKLTVDRYNYHSLSHELGHATQYFTAPNFYPEHIKKMIDKLKSDPNTIKKLQFFAKFYEEIITSYIPKMEDQFIQYIVREYPGGYEEYKRKVKENYEQSMKNPDKLWCEIIMRSGGNTPSLANTVLFYNMRNNIPIKEEDYFYMTLENDKNTFVSCFVHQTFGSILMIENLMDAIFDGKWKDNSLVGVDAKCYSGHGALYFQHKPVFNEIFANISSLLTAIPTEFGEIEKELRFLLGDDLYQALVDYYNIIDDEVKKVV